MAVFFRSDVVDVIFNTLDWDRHRGGHTVESLLRVFTDLGILPTLEQWPGWTGWTETGIRLVIASLLTQGCLDMRPDGLLTVPESSPEPSLEKFQGAWFVTTPNGHVKGPYYDVMEATNVYHSFRTGNLNHLASVKG